jgi:ferritin-like protein
MKNGNSYTGNGGEIRCAEVARIGDRNHVEAIVPRIYELGGKLPDSMVDFHNISGCQAAKFPAIPRDIKAMLTTLVEVERCAVRQYANVCNLIVGKDHQTDDLSSLSSLKRSNISHGSRSSLLKARPGISCERVGPSRLFKIPGVKNRLIFFFIFILRYYKPEIKTQINCRCGTVFRTSGSFCNHRNVWND